MRSSAQKRELGQVLVISALLLPVLLAMTGLAIDVGTYAANRRSLQNAADGAALAAGQDLPDSSAATISAIDYTNSHNIDPAHVDVTVTGGSTSPAVEVEITRDHDFAFMGIIGIGSKSVTARAKAAKYSFGGGPGVVPWSVTQDTVDAASSGDEVTIKYDSNGNYGEGNFGAIRIDGNGGSDYESAAKYGSSNTVCSSLMPNCTPASCPGTFPATCAETAPDCDGSECAPKTGNMTGSTRDAVDFRTGYTSADCDTFDEAFTPRNALLPSSPGEHVASFGGRLAAPGPTDTPVPTSTLGPTITPGPVNRDEYGLNPACNPWTGGACTSTTALCSRRVFLIPVVDSFGNGTSDPLEIRGFALVFLEGYDPPCSGSSCDIRARFVAAQFTSGFFTGSYDPDATTHFVKLIE